ncbi:MAG: TVP38/TMEM64 family protein [Hyphomicrobiaceae bacterium]
MTKPGNPPEPATAKAGSPLTRWLPVAVIAGLMVVAYALGLHRYLSLQAIGENYGALRAMIDANFVLALLAYMASYVAVVALSLPGGLFMTLAGGLLFGPLVAIPAIVIAATAGATIVFLIAKTSLGETLAARAGPWVGKLRAGFQENALSYMLFLRLVPAFPFVVVNLAPALLGVRLSTYVIGTLIGIVPGTSAYALVGASLGAPLEAENARHAACVAANGIAGCAYSIDLSQLVSRELIFAGIALGIVALIPVVYSRFKKRSKSHAAA